MGSSFRPAFGHLFERQINSTKKKDINKARQAKEAVDYLLDGNLQSAKWLGYEYQGKRSYRKGKVRIVFAHCEECRKLDHQEHNGCEECDSNGDDTLRFFAFGDRDEIYDILSSHRVWRG